MASAALNTVFSIPLRHLWVGELAPLGGPSPVESLNEHLFPTSHIGIDRFVGDSTNSLLGYLSQPVLADTDWPVLFYGDSATGKTSLALTLIARATEHASASPTYVTAVDYVRRFNSALQTNSIDDFRSQLLSASGLVIDDIDKMADKIAAQRELVHLLDRISTPVAITSTCSPMENNQLLPQLVSRLSEGLLMPCHRPGPDARAEILVDLAKLHELDFCDSAVKWLADRLNVTATRLNSLLARLKNSHRVTESDKPISIEMLEDLFEKNYSRKPIENTKIIQDIVSADFDLSASDLIGKSRKQTVVLARGISIYLCRELLEISYLKIGSLFGGRDHSTVMHAYRKYKKFVDDPENSPIKKRILKFKQTLSNRFSSSLHVDEP